MAEYVDKAENLSEAKRIINHFWRKGSERLPIIAQEFIKSPTHRITIIGNKIVQTALKESDKWKTIGNCAEHFRKFKVDKELNEIVNKINKHFAMKIYGIDLFKKDGKWLVLEINSAPAFDFFPEERKKLIIEILDFLKKEVRKR
jgi:glutathione synthase/RimK-type ligase-like ATP-grasp enzyme